MLNFKKLSLLLTLMFFLRQPVIGKIHCTLKCGGVHIQFPFYLRNSNLNQTTDYPPGFDLLCTEKDETMLELPAVPIKLFVRNIDYEFQRIEIYEPENCLPSQLLKLGNASVSPFNFAPQPYNSPGTNVSFFRCDSMSCPILLLPSDQIVYYNEPFIYYNNIDILSCTKVKDVLFVQWKYYYYHLYGGMVLMEWSKPDCGYCEAQGQKCKWKNGTNGETECFVCPTNRTPTSTIVLIATVRCYTESLFALNMIRQDLPNSHCYASLRRSIKNLLNQDWKEMSAWLERKIGP
ncbi:putative RING-H2 finger protein ATL21B [Spatholobus suberectus]|nr:putative RING-H2 finger protein ATL21B [Spatholobus suberectus]